MYVCVYIFIYVIIYMHIYVYVYVYRTFWSTCSCVQVKLHALTIHSHYTS